MKKSFLYSSIFFSTLLIHSCSNEGSKQEPTEFQKEESDQERKSEIKSEEKTYLIENTIKHAFSDPTKKDEFRISIKGKSLLKGKVLFTITSWDGKKILSEEFDANYLLGYDFTGNINSKKETDAFIEKRIASFFANDKFSVPAIADDVVFEDQSYYIDKETWEEVKANKQSIGFYYLLGKEDGRHIAFSKKQGKVVMYYNCC
jgi:hypothetical protein